MNKPGLHKHKLSGIALAISMMLAPIIPAFADIAYDVHIRSNHDDGDGIVNYNVFGNGTPGSFNWSSGQALGSGWPQSTVTNKHILVEGTVTNVYGASGGYAENSSGNASVTGSSATIRIGYVGGDVVGGRAFVDSGLGDAEALQNTVNISTSTGRWIHGGSAIHSGNGSATARLRTH